MNKSQYKNVVIDSETNGFLDTVSEIHCIGLLDLDTLEYKHFVGDDIIDCLLLLADADMCVGHNIKQYDFPVFEKLTDNLIQFDYSKMVDTLELSRMLFPGLGSHKLARWGGMLGYPKLDFHDFDKLTHEMLVYMERDVKLNYKVYQILMATLASDSVDPSVQPKDQ